MTWDSSPPGARNVSTCSVGMHIKFSNTYVSKYRVYFHSNKNFKSYFNQDYRDCSISENQCKKYLMVSAWVQNTHLMTCSAWVYSNCNILKMPKRKLSPKLELQWKFFSESSGLYAFPGGTTPEGRPWWKGILHSLRELIRTHRAAHAFERLSHTFLKTFGGTVTLTWFRMTGLDMSCSFRCKMSLHYDFNGRRVVGYNQYMLYICR